MQIPERFKFRAQSIDGDGFSPHDYLAVCGTDTCRVTWEVPDSLVQYPTEMAESFVRRGIWVITDDNPAAIKSLPEYNGIKLGDLVKITDGTKAYPLAQDWADGHGLRQKFAYNYAPRNDEAGIVVSIGPMYNMSVTFDAKVWRVYAVELEGGGVVLMRQDAVKLEKAAEQLKERS
jgi:hypothetical protein